MVVVGAWPTGAFGGLDLELYLDLGLGGSEIKCKKVCTFFFIFFIIFLLLFRFSRDFLLLRAETNSARMANRVGKVFLQSRGREWEWSGVGGADNAHGAQLCFEKIFVQTFQLN